MGSVPSCISNVVSKETKILLLRLFLFNCYMYAGVFVFMAIEGEPAKKQIEEKKAGMESLKNITMAKYNMTEDEFVKLVNKLKTLACANVPEWNYDHAISFTVQLLTTIGYGNFTPRTATGQIITIVYAIFGIPLTILTLKSVGEGYNRLVKCIITMVENCFCRTQNENTIKNLELKMLLANIFVLTALVFTAAGVSHAQDFWNIRQGVYVWFITLTTVGFGDFVPGIMMEGHQPNGLLFPGLCFMAGVVDAMVEFVNKADVQVVRCKNTCLCCNKSNQSSQVDDDGSETFGTKNHSSNNMGFEEAHQQTQNANSSIDTTL